MRNSEDNIIFPLSFFFFLPSASNCSYADTQHGCLLCQVVHHRFVVVYFERQKLKELLQNFLLRSSGPRWFWTHSIISTATRLDATRALGSASLSLGDWLITTQKGLLRPCQEQDRPPGPQGGWRKIDVSLFHTIITSFFPLSWGDSITSTHLLLLLLICLVWVQEQNQCFQV